MRDISTSKCSSTSLHLVCVCCLGSFVRFSVMVVVMVVIVMLVLPLLLLLLLCWVVFSSLPSLGFPFAYMLHNQCLLCGTWKLRATETQRARERKKENEGE